MDGDRPFGLRGRYATRPPGVAGGIPVSEVGYPACGYSPVQS
jgi:hypothetical protein